MKKFLNINLFLILAAILINFNLSVAQEVKEKQVNIVENMVQKLQQKVLLSDQQSIQVKSILNSYAQDISEKSKNDADKKIENLLDAKQKAKYGIIKGDWWNELNKNVSKAESSK